MKTIMISAFEGVEVKNIARTAVLKTLLDDPGIRVVLLMKSAERIAHYRKEFTHSSIELVIAPYSRSLGKGIDRWFAQLKIIMLDTPTTRLRRRLQYEATGRAFSYYVTSALSFVLARRLFRRIVRWADFLLVRRSVYRELFNDYAPDLVFLAHLFEEPEIHILREAKRRGVPSVGFVNSWDKITARAMMRLLPDRAIVFNHTVRQEMVDYNDMRPEEVFVAGIPQYDMYATHPKGFSSREDFCARMNIPPNNRIIVYAPMGSAFSNSDWEMIDLIDAMVRSGEIGEQVSLIVRFQPNDFIDLKELERRPHLVYDHPGVRFARERGVDWDMTETDLRHLTDTLAHMSLLVCYASSISIDAAMFDKPIININFEINPAEHRNPFERPTRFYHTAHYKNAIDTGGIRLVDSRESLAQWLQTYLADPAIDHEARQRLVDEQAVFRDGGSGQRIGNYLLSFLRQGPVVARRR